MKPKQKTFVRLLSFLMVMAMFASLPLTAFATNTAADANSYGETNASVSQTETTAETTPQETTTATSEAETSPPETTQATVGDTSMEIEVTDVVGPTTNDTTEPTEAELTVPAVQEGTELVSEPTQATEETTPAATTETDGVMEPAMMSTAPAAQAVIAVNATVSASSSNTSNVPHQMLNNWVLDALAYTGYDVDWLIENGKIYQPGWYGAALTNDDVMSEYGIAKKDLLSNISYSGDLFGTDTIADASTVTGRAPDIERFERYGIDCTAYASYYYFNYLRNIEGVDIQYLWDNCFKMDEHGKFTPNGYTARTVYNWRAGAEKAVRLGLAQRIGTSKSCLDDALPGDLLIFQRQSDKVYSHVAIYIGEYNGLHFLGHVGNSRGPEIQTVEAFENSSESKRGFICGVYRFNCIPTEVTGEIKVYKTDDNGNALSGACFVATHQNTGDRFYIGPTDNAGYAHVNDIPYGTYTVVETVFPAGYAAGDTTSWTVTVDEGNNSTVTLNIENKIIRGGFLVQKRTPTNTKLAGWKFFVYDSAGTQIGEYVTNDAGYFIVEGLAPGEYTYREAYHFPYGESNLWNHESMNEDFIAVVAPGEISTYEVYNEGYGEIQIQKNVNWGDDIGMLAGWQVRVWASDNSFSVTLVTDENGKASIDGLDVTKTYHVQEVIPNSTIWHCDENIYTVTLTEGESATVNIWNNYPGSLEIEKTTATGDNLEGWIFDIWAEDGSFSTRRATDENGYILLSGLKSDTLYFVQEVDTGLEGWCYVSEPVEVVVWPDEESQVSFHNYQEASLKIQKQTNNGGNLAGWQFGVYRDVNCNSPIEGSPFVTDENGEILIENIAARTYYVKELGATDAIENAEYWELDAATKSVTLEPLAVTTVDFTNRLCALEIQKYVNDSPWNAHYQEYLEIGDQITFHIWSEEDHIDFDEVHTIDSEGKIVLTGLQEGRYYIQEINCPTYDGWQCDDSDYFVDVVDGEITYYEHYNYYGDTLRIRKTTSDGKNIQNIEFEIYTDDGELFSKAWTNANGIIELAVPYGTYIVKEILPENSLYECETENPLRISVNEIMSEEAHFHNVLKDEGTLTVQKYVNGEKWYDYWADFLKTGETITFRLWSDETGYDETKSIDVNGQVTFTKVPSGSYKLQEVNCPTYWNWMSDDAIYDVEIVIGETTHHDHYNEYGGDIQIIKTASDGNVEGIEFEIRNENGDVVFRGRTDTDGELLTGTLPVGTYVVEEILPADSVYVVEGENPVTVEVYEDETAEIEFHNILNIGNLHIQKETNTDGDLAGWEIGIYTDEACTNAIEGSPFITDDNGEIYIEALTLGMYYVREVGGPGYGDVAWDCDDGVHIVEIMSGDTSEVVIVNTLLSGSIKVEKLNYLNQHLAGATFLLEWSEDGETWNPVIYSDKTYAVKGGCSAEGLSDGYVVTDESGIIEFINLYPGLQYRLSETDAPDGYIKMSDYAYVGELPADEDFAVHLRVYNSKGYILPSTGIEDSTFRMVMGGAMLMLLAICMGAVFVVRKFHMCPAVNTQGKATTENMKRRKVMKGNLFTRLFCLMLCLCMVGGMATTAFAAEVNDAVIDPSKTGSVTIYKIDMTSAVEDGVLNNSYVATGTYNQGVYDALIGNGSTTTQGDGDTTHGYAIDGVVFSYLKVADIKTFSQNNTIELLYGVESNDQLLTILGLTQADASATEGTKYYYAAEVLNDALQTALTSETPNAVKSALEQYMVDGGTAMPETDAYGKTSATNLPLGLYLFVETKVSERVMTCNPFLLSVPMTSADGDEWLYDLTVFPKNETDVPTLEKEVVERTGETVNTEGFAHAATASAGDIVDYRITSGLPTITSGTTYLKTYTFTDNLSKGITYTKGDVVLTWYKDADLSEKIAEWDESSEKFTVSYTDGENGSEMVIRMTNAGLHEINTSSAAWGANSAKSGYSNCYVCVTYTATVNSDASVVYGDSGNPNDVELTWKRTSDTHYDQLIDDCHVYVYAIDVTKEFVDNKGNFANVKFELKNTTDEYWVIAQLNEAEGVYYITGNTAVQAEATQFVPVAHNVMTDEGEKTVHKVVVKGLEDDAYELTETKTDEGYSLLEKPAEIVITVAESDTYCDIYDKDTAGEVQTMAHKLLTASATVNGEAWEMDADGESINAVVALTIKNHPKFNIPQTGETGATMMPIIGGTIIALCLCGAVVLFATGKKKNHA